jgi:putative transposase
MSDDQDLPVAPKRSFLKLKKDPRRYRRTLPHIQDTVPMFVTFNTHSRWELPSSGRDLAMQSCMHEDGSRLRMHAVVIMPEHVHMLFTLINDDAFPPMYRIIGDIKGASSHKINKLLSRNGTVWPEESFDRATRSNEFQYYMDYIIMNPVRRALVKSPEEYPWLWWDKTLTWNRAPSPGR